MPQRATITLYVDPVAYRDETGERLTKATLDALGRQVNADAATICGYEGWQTKFVSVPDRRSR